MENKLTLKEWLPLIGMTVSAFIFNTSEFMPIGLLTDIAADFQMTEAQAGMLITIYAYVVMLMSLPRRFAMGSSNPKVMYPPNAPSVTGLPSCSCSSQRRHMSSCVSPAS